MPLADEFNRQVLKISKELTVDEVIVVNKKLGFEALRRTVEKTPVDTGRARGNWQVGIDARPPDDVIEPASRKLGKKSGREGSATGSSSAPPLGSLGSAVAGRGEIRLRKVKPFGQIFITNNVPYIEYLEDGSSTQAPNGMVALTVQELLEIFR